MENCIFLTIFVIPISSLIFCGLLGVVYTLWWKPKSLEKNFRSQGIKGTSYSLFQGEKEEMLRASLESWSKPMSLNHKIVPYVLPFIHQTVQKYGKFSLGWNGTRPRLTAAEPELIRLVLGDKSGHIIKPPLNPLVDLLQKGVSTLEGESWAKRRKLITPAFHLHKLKGMAAAFSSSCIDLINRWKKLSCPGSCEIDVAPEFNTLAGDVIARTAFGSSYEEGKRIFELQKQQIALVLEAHYAMYFPGLSNDDDLLGMLLKCTEQTENDLKIEDVIEECKLFYFAGQETTANLLTWTMIILCMHPNWQEKAREEVLNTCGKKMPDIEDLNRLKIVSMILHEVLRLYPPVTALFRYTCRRINIGGFSVPPSVEITLPLLLLHHDPMYWGSDADEFNPDRFADGVAKASMDQLAFYTFGWGPRICLGQNFAMIEAKMALAMILQNFTFEISASYTHSPITVITLQPKHGAPIILHQTQ
ncbi:cytochrome P450 11 [Citrus sinensis]|uniref:Cytochrome P450 11 n=1 Tax=Citrus sinensis TaxID=2711 RepID=A0ACB8P685_CITSI|nr:cytochrome P450 11 [Citrus sinensis]